MKTNMTRATRWLVILLLVLAGPGVLFAAGSDWHKGEGAKFRVFTPYKNMPATGDVVLGVHFKMEKGWHVYWMNGGDSGLPTTADFSATPELNEASLLYPAPHKYKEFGDLIAFGYSDEVVFPVTATVGASGDKSVKVTATVGALVCKKKCIPVNQVLSFAQPVAEEVQIDPQQLALIDIWKQRVPVPLETVPGVSVTASIWSEGPVLEISVDAKDADASGVEAFPEPSPLFYFTPLKNMKAQPLTGGKRFLIPLMAAEEGPLPESAQVGVTLTGLVTALGPVDVRATVTAYRKEGFPPAAPVVMETKKEGMTASLPLFLLFGLIGGLILNVMPCVLPVVSLKVFAVIQSAGEGRGAVVKSNLATALGILVSFWALAVMAIIAKSAGVAVGWGVQFQEPVFVTFLGVVVLLFALNLWGLFEIPMPRWASKLGGSGSESFLSHFATGLFATLLATPCSAPFLGTAIGFGLSQAAPVIFAVFTAMGIGMALPYLTLATLPGLAKYFPQPGNWMLNVRVLMGFFLAATLVWLLYVLAAQIESVGLAYVELCLVTLALFVWLMSIARGRKVLHMILMAAVILTAIGSVYLAGTYKGTAVAKQTSHETGGEHLQWADFNLEKIQSLQAAGKPVLVNITADWCFTCKAVEKAVLENPDVVKALKDRNVNAFRGDWTNRNDALAAYMASFGKYGVPFNALFIPGKEPVVFSEVFSKETFLKALGN